MKKVGDAFFHNGALGLSTASTAGVDTGFNREPGGTLNSMTRGGKNHQANPAMPWPTEP